MRVIGIFFLLCLVLFILPLVSAHAFVCNVSATGLNFGGYDVFSSTPLDSTGTVSVTCNMPPQHPRAPMMVKVSLSPGNSGNFTQRWMQQTAGPDTLRYNLYTNASMSTIWGDGGSSSSIFTGEVTSASPLNTTIYGRIPAQQNVRAGTYSDIITVTVDF